MLQHKDDHIQKNNSGCFGYDLKTVFTQIEDKVFSPFNVGGKAPYFGFKKETAGGQREQAVTWAPALVLTQR